MESTAPNRPLVRLAYGTSRWSLDEDEAALLTDFRRCSERRQRVILNMARKFANLEWPDLVKVITTNILPFKRRKDD